MSQDWIVDERGNVYHSEDQHKVDPIIVTDSIESTPLRFGPNDLLTSQRIDRLVREEKITIPEAESIRHQTKNMDFMEKHNFLSAIEHRGKRRT